VDAATGERLERRSPRSGDEVPEDGLDGKKLASMKLTRWSKLKEKLNNAADADAKVDRKKYALTLYARTVFFVDGVLQCVEDVTDPVIGSGDVDWTRIALFAGNTQDWFWNFDNNGLRLAQLRFYEL